MKVEWKDGAYYAKLFQQKVASDKLIIRYRPGGDDVVYRVRMFDPVPVVQRVDLASTLGTNTTAENITATPVNVTDADNDTVKNITDYRLHNGSDFVSIAVLNMPFENNTADVSATTKDYSGFGNNGTINGATFNASGGLDGFGAYEFDGSDDFINIDSAQSDLIGTTTGTWAVWVKPVDATPVSIKIMISFSDTNANEFVHIRLKTDGVLRAKATKSGTSQWQLDTNSSVFSDNVWMHIALVQDGISPVVYVDGIAVAQNFGVTTDKTVWFNNLTGLDNGRIGDRNVNSGGETNHFNGLIDEVRIYNRSLSAEQILALFNNRTDLIVSQETSVGDVWQACVTPNDGSSDGVEVCSNNLTILTSCTCPPTDTDLIIDLSESCVLNVDCDLGTGNLSFINAGAGNKFTINATLNVSGLATLADGRIEGTSTAVLNVKN